MQSGPTSRSRRNSPNQASATVLVIVPLLIGGVLYLGFRTDELLMFRAAHALGLDGGVEALREGLRPFNAHLPVWVVYSLPHALWTFSMLVFFGHVWREHPVQRRVWITGAVAGSTGSELAQALSLIPGTFSIPDLLSIACAWLAYAFLAGYTLHKASGMHIHPPPAPSYGSTS